MVKVGFLGVGTISHSIVRGMLEAGLLDHDEGASKFAVSEVNLSPRGVEKVEDLSKVHEDLKKSKKLINLNLCSCNQEVVDQSDWIFIGIHHKKVGEVLSLLHFRPETLIISMASLVTRQQIYEFTKQVIPVENIYRATPLPASRHLHGTTLIFPPNEKIGTFYGCLGSIVQVSTVEELLKLQTATAFMGDFYQRSAVITNWLKNEGVDKGVAASYVAKLFATIVSDATELCESNEDVFEILVKEQTPGGLNEAVITEQRSAGAYELLQKSLDKSKERFSGAGSKKRKESS